MPRSVKRIAVLSASRQYHSPAPPTLTPRPHSRPALPRPPPHSAPPRQRATDPAPPLCTLASFFARPPFVGRRLGLRPNRRPKPAPPSARSARFATPPLSTALRTRPRSPCRNTPGHWFSFQLHQCPEPSADLSPRFPVPPAHTTLRARLRLGLRASPRRRLDPRICRAGAIACATVWRVTSARPHLRLRGLVRSKPNPSPPRVRALRHAAASPGHSLTRARKVVEELKPLAFFSETSSRFQTSHLNEPLSARLSRCLRSSIPTDR